MTNFSETLMDHCQSPRHQGRMDAPDRVGIAGTPGQGRYIILYLRIAGERIQTAQFDCYGCGVTIAVCSVLTELVEGRTCADCAALRATDIVEALDGIPPHKADCAHFGIVALQNALEKREPTVTEPVTDLDRVSTSNSALLPQDQRVTQISG